MLVIIPAVFYAYTAFVEGIFLVDIATFMVAVIIGQLLSIKLYKQTQGPKLTELISLAFIILLAVIFVAFTFYPPHLPIFLDSSTGQYGMP
jgi:uncharacterized membrane protein YoaK (UPF0700 family)